MYDPSFYRGTLQASRDITKDENDEKDKEPEIRLLQTKLEISHAPLSSPRISSTSQSGSIMESKSIPTTE